MRRDDRDLLEGQHAPVDQSAGIARQCQMDAGERRYCPRAAEHLHSAGSDMALDVIGALERRQCCNRLGNHRAVGRRRNFGAAEPIGQGDHPERKRH